MAVATNSVEGVLADFLTPIIIKIIREPTRESLIKLQRIIITNADSVVLNLVG